jgi:hypothetical protein
MHRKLQLAIEVNVTTLHAPHPQHRFTRKPPPPLNIKIIKAKLAKLAPYSP